MCFLLDQFGQAKVQDLHQVVLAHHDVVPLDIAMHYSRFMRCRERRSNLYPDVQDFRQLHRAAFHALAQRLTLNKLGGNEMRAVCLADFINRQDVGVIECRRGSCLSLKSPQVFRVVCQFVGQNFDGHLAAQIQVLRQINFAHAARAELL